MKKLEINSYLFFNFIIGLNIFSHQSNRICEESLSTPPLMKNDEQRILFQYVINNDVEATKNYVKENQIDLSEIFYKGTAKEISYNCSKKKKISLTKH